MYQALIISPNLTTHEIASQTKLPRTRIYEVLSKLAAKKLVVKETHGAGYRLLSPSESLSMLSENLANEFREHQDTIQEFAEYLQAVYENNIGSNISPGVSIFPFQDVENALLDHLKKAKKRVFIAVSTHTQSIDWKKSGSAMAEAFHPDLDIRYLTSNDKLSSRIFEAFTRYPHFKKINLQIKSNTELHSSYIIIDNVIYLFFLGHHEKTTLESLILRTSSTSLLKSFEWMYTQLWKEGLMPK